MRFLMWSQPSSALGRMVETFPLEVIWVESQTTVAPGDGKPT